MEKNLFSLKYRLRKTDEPVEIVAWETTVKGARSETDWVSYIDSHGNEHIMERLTLEWDFVIENSGDGVLSEALSRMDPWEARRYELAREFVTDGLADIEGAVAMADELITKLKKSPEADKKNLVLTWKHIAKIVTIYEEEIDAGRISRYESPGFPDVKEASEIILKKYNNYDSKRTH